MSSITTPAPRLGTLAAPTPDLGTLAGRPSRERSRTIGVLMLDAATPAKASVLFAVQAAARAAGYLVSIIGLPVPDRGRVLGAVARLRELGAEGVLLIAPPVGVIEALAATAGRIPVIATACGPLGTVSTVTGDSYGGAAVTTRHLLELGHRTVFHIAGPPGEPDSSLRVAGWRDALMAAGAVVPAALRGDGTPAGGYELGRQVGLRAEVTAIFAAGDQMALGVLRALRELERRVPEDVSVVGFGGIPEGEFFTPPLTTVRQNFGEIGRRSFELLRREIDLGRQAKIHHTIPSELIVRATTMAAGRRLASNGRPALSGVAYTG